MNWDQVQGKWSQMRGSVREKWGRLTDSDYEQVAGNREKFLGRLQERYGYAREQAEKEVDEWMRTHIETEAPPKARGGSGR